MDKKLQDIINRISSHINPTKIYLFGSRARGDHRPDSDYDIVIIYDGDKSKRDLKLEIYKLFDHWDFTMDLFVLASGELERFKHVANTMAREVYENGVAIYG
jgi:predicted nucleotidyltransferase